MRFIFIPAAKQNDPLLAEPITVEAEASAAGDRSATADGERGSAALVEGVVVRLDDRQCVVDIRPASAAAKLGKGDLAVLR
jgi:hypothetical protein